MPGRPLAVYVDPIASDLFAAPAMLEEAGFAFRQAVVATEEDVIREARGAAVLLTGEARIGSAAIAALQPELRLIATASVGHDHIDRAAAGAAGVWVCNVPDAASEEVAVHALGMALDLIRRITFYDRELRGGGWLGEHIAMPGRPSELTLGIVGMGRIGRLLAERAAPVFGTVLGSDPVVPADAFPPGVRPCGLDELLASSDAVSLHVPLTGETERLVDAGRIARMRPGACLVNVSRAGLVDGPALVAALDSGHLAGAAVDVFAAEPAAAADPARHHPRILATPHVAYLSDRSAPAYMERMARNAIGWLRDGRPSTHVVEGRP